MSSERFMSRSSLGRVGVLLIHSPGGAPAEVPAIAHRLERADYVVHSPRLAGGSGNRWQDWYASAEDALLELRQTCETVIVGGFATGAIVGLLLAARHPDKVHGTALFAPRLYLHGSSWRERLLPHKGLLGGEASGADLEPRRLAHDLKRELTRIAQPALIVQARRQDGAGFDDAWQLQRNLKGLVEMVVLDDVRGLAAVERAVSFLERLPAQFKQRAKVAPPAWRAPAQPAAHLGVQASAA
jgi:carboxylesterase